MTDKIDGGPAFPTKIWDRDIEGNRRYPGMSLRDYFAAAALTGIYASGPNGMEADGDKLPLKDWAKCAYAQADAMLLERMKK